MSKGKYYAFNEAEYAEVKRLRAAMAKGGAVARLAEAAITLVRRCERDRLPVEVVPTRDALTAVLKLLEGGQP